MKLNHSFVFFVKDRPGSRGSWVYFVRTEKPGCKRHYWCYKQSSVVNNGVFWRNVCNRTFWRATLSQASKTGRVPWLYMWVKPEIRPYFRFAWYEIVARPGKRECMKADKIGPQLRLMWVMTNPRGCFKRFLFVHNCSLRYWNVRERAQSTKRCCLDRKWRRKNYACHRNQH